MRRVLATPEGRALYRQHRFARLGVE